MVRRKPWAFLIALERVGWRRDQCSGGDKAGTSWKRLSCGTVTRWRTRLAILVQGSAGRGRSSTPKPFASGLNYSALLLCSVLVRFLSSGVCPVLGTHPVVALSGRPTPLAPISSCRIWNQLCHILPTVHSWEKVCPCS